MKSNLSNKNKSKKTKGSGVKNSQFFPLSKSGTGKDFELLLFPLKEISVSPPWKEIMHIELSPNTMR